MATLNSVLVHSALLPIPKNDAQVAFAVGADPNPALANNPLAMAPATRAPVILRGEFTLLSAINCCSIHDKNASIPLVTMSRLTLTGSGSADVYAAESVPLGCSSRIRCRHLLKTFWIGAGGWADRQLSDGTVVWTAPSGQTYTTTPAGAEFFPQLGVPTGEFAAATHHRAPLRRARGDDADPLTRPRPGQGLTNRAGTTTQRATPGRRTPTTPSLARRHLRTTTLLVGRRSLVVMW